MKYSFFYWPMAQAFMSLTIQPHGRANRVLNKCVLANSSPSQWIELTHRVVWNVMFSFIDCQSNVLTNNQLWNPNQAANIISTYLQQHQQFSSSQTNQYQPNNKIWKTTKYPSSFCWQQLFSSPTSFKSIRNRPTMQRMSRWPAINQLSKSATPKETNANQMQKRKSYCHVVNVMLHSRRVRHSR